MDMSEVILNLFPRKKRGSNKNFCSTRDQVPNYSMLFLELGFVGGGST
jgi:hypothetical protein